jgi:hypothetical protein
MPHTPPRAAKAEELFDVQHQAEFFVSIGKDEEAISILLDHIGGDVHTSALIYLDLFSLYHKLKRKDEYQELATSFNAMFNALVPDFDAYHARSRGLESYPPTLDRIRRVWPRPSVLTLMESLIFQQPGVKGEAFEPEAFRELLFLYGIAGEIVDAEADALQQSSQLDFNLPDIESDADPSGVDVATMPADPEVALPFIPAPLSLDAVMMLDIDLNMLADVASRDATDSRLSGTVALSRGTPSVSMGNLIDFEALTPDTPAGSRLKVTPPSRH